MTLWANLWLDIASGAGGRIRWLHGASSLAGCGHRPGSVRSYAALVETMAKGAPGQAQQPGNFRYISVGVAECLLE